MAMNPTYKYVKTFDRKLNALLSKVFYAASKLITDKSNVNNVDKILKRIFARYGVDTQLKDILNKMLLKSISIGTGPLAKKRFDEKKIYNYKLTLKTLATDITRKSEAVETIKKQIMLNRAWRQAAQSMTDKKLIRGDVAKDVRELLSKARAAARNSGGEDEFRRYSRRVFRRIEGLVEGDTSKLKRAYMDVVELTENSSAKQIRTAQKYAIEFKARRNAERIAITETNRAYNNGVLAESNEDEDIIALQWTMSGAHTIYDICNVYAEQNLCGLGPGIYPKDEAPACPAHPYCNCMLVPVYEGEIKEKNGRWSQSRINKVYDSLPKSKKKLVKKKAIKGVKYQQP